MKEQAEKMNAQFSLLGWGRTVGKGRSEMQQKDA
jgi:hypothetical protein